MLDQRDTYINGLGPLGIDPDTLHVVWGGSNDLTDIIETVIVDPGFNPLPAMENILTNLVDIVASLAVADAKSILVPNIPNLGLVPLITGGGPVVTEATLLSSMFNAGLADAMDSIAATYPDTKLFELDVFSLFADDYLDPAAYGFTNVTDGCYSEFVIAGGSICANPSEYLSWGGFHPTTTAHEFLAVNVVVPIPAAV